MAEAIFNRLHSELGEARSRGLFAAEGGNASPNTLQVLKENGIDFSHQSKQLQEQDVEWATHILTMTAAHKEMILQQYPNVKEKIFTLKEYVNKQQPNDGDLDVIDPIGGNIDTYRATYKELFSLIEKIDEKGE